MLDPLLQKLLFVRQFNSGNGKIELLGSRYVMLDATAIAELQAIDKTKLFDLAKRAAFKNIASFVEHGEVYKNLKILFTASMSKIGRKIGSTDKGMLKSLQDFFNLYGLGSLNIVNIDNNKKQALLKVADSSLAVQRSKKPSCTLIAGILAGIFSYLFKKQVDCVETKCKSAGSSSCQFKVA